MTATTSTVPATTSQPARSSTSQTLGRLIRGLAPYRLAVLLLALAVVAGILAELLPPLIIRHILDDVLTRRAPERQLAWLVAGFLGARTLIAAAEVARGWLSVWLGGRVAADMRGRLHGHFQRLPMRFFHAWPVGVLMSRVTTDAGRLEEFVANTVPLLAVNVLMLTGILAYIAHASWRLALWALVPVPFIMATAAALWTGLKRALDRQASHWARLSGHLVESLAGLQVVKAFSQEGREAARFSERNEHVMRSTVGAERRSFALFSVIYFLMNLGVFLAWYVGGREVIRGTLPLGVLLAVIAYLWMFYWPLQWLGQVAGATGQAVVGAERVFEVLDTAPEPYDDPTAMPMARADGVVTFRDVWFGYDAKAPVLRGVDLHVRAGETIGVVGRSGAGKTTLMALLCRFYDTQSGRIEIDGVDIRRIRLADVRGQIGIVAQDPFLFAGSVADNIRLGRPSASLDDVIAAAVAANAHGFILARPEGYDADVGECGRRLSGGEKQRIAIARAILRNPRILILDEATSQLDARAEASIRDAVRLLSRNRTTFVIAHRLPTVRHADRIIVIEEGRIAEAGTHEELMARHALYHRFVSTQRGMRALITSAGGGP